MGITRTILFILCLLSSQLLVAQKQGLRSNLIKKLEVSKTDIEKLEVIFDIVRYGFYTNTRSTLLGYIELADQIAKDNSDEEIRALNGLIQSFKYENNNNFSKKETVLRKSLKHFKTQNDTTKIIECLYYLGELNFRISRSELALKYLSELTLIIPSNDHEYYSLSQRKLSRTYSRMNQDSMALTIIDDMLQWYEQRPNFKWDGNHIRHYMVKGLILDKANRTRESVTYTKKAMLEAERLGNKPALNSCKSDLSIYYYKLGQLEKARELAHEAYDHFEILKLNYPSMNAIRLSLGDIYFELGQYDVAKNYFNDALKLAKEHHRLLNEKNAIKGIIKCDIIQNDNKKTVIEKLEYYDSLKDSLFNKDMVSALQDIKVKYETEIKEEAIEQLNEQNLLVEDHLKKARRTNLLLGFAVLLLLLAGIGLVRLFLQRMQSQKLLESQNKIIQKSLEEKQLLLKEIHHRVKNNLQTISSLLSLQTSYIDDPKVIAAIKDGQNRVQSMALIHQNLYQDDQLNHIQAKSYFEKLVRGLYVSYKIDKDKVNLNLDISDLKINIETINPIGLITNELVCNTFKYAFPDDKTGELTVSLLALNNDELELRIADDGIGIDTNIIKNAKHSFGYQMIQAFCNKLDAKMHIDGSQGTDVRIIIPYKNTPT